MGSDTEHNRWDGDGADETGGIRLKASPHLLVLTPRDNGSAKRPSEAGLTPAQKLKLLIDEQSHAEELRFRSLSMKPRGFEFPPSSAESIGNALIISLKKFLNEHPLSELTAVAVAYLAALAAWRMATSPWRALAKLLKTRRNEAVEAKSRAKATKKPLPLMAVVPASEEVTKWRSDKVEKREESSAEAGPRTASWKVSLALAVTVLLLPAAIYAAIGYAMSTAKLAMADGAAGVTSLMSAADSVRVGDFTSARDGFDRAYTSFTKADERLGLAGRAVSAVAGILPIRTSVAAAAPMIAAGRDISIAGSEIASGAAQAVLASDPVDQVEAIRGRLTTAIPHLERAEAALAAVDSAALPAPYRQPMATTREKMPELIGGLKRAASAASLLEDLMGADGAKRYLVIFQNNAELRPTGGFIGSFALLDVDRGRIKSLEMPKGGSYDLQGSQRAKLVSPRPLHLINPNWEFQDANWYPDFPTSAEKLAWFYEKSGGPTVDGVIAVTARAMEDLLEITGPVEMEEYGKTIDSRNFWFETQKQVEIEYDKSSNQPKKFLADLAPKMIDKIMAADKDAAIGLLGAADASLAGKEVIIWAKDGEAQDKVLALGWAGDIKPTDGDYLTVVHTNIAGQKTDSVMDESISQTVKVLPDASATATLTIKRTHNGQKGALFNGVRNVDWLRVYVPEGSSLVEARGFDTPDPKLFKIPDSDRVLDDRLAAEESTVEVDRRSQARTYSESGKTVFAGWVQTDPGETSSVTLVYKLPPDAIDFKEASDGASPMLALIDRGARSSSLSYSLLVQKQPGAKPPSFSLTVDLPRGWRPSWQSKAMAADDNGRWTSSWDLDRDAAFGLLAEGN
jgi:hypothetical protein